MDKSAYMDQTIEVSRGHNTYRTESNDYGGASTHYHTDFRQKFKGGAEKFFFENERINNSPYVVTRGS